MLKAVSVAHGADVVYSHMHRSYVATGIDELEAELPDHHGAIRAYSGIHRLVYSYIILPYLGSFVRAPFKLNPR